MSDFPTYVSLDLVADLIPLSRKTLRNMKCLGTITFLHHVDDRGQYSRKLLVHMADAMAYWIERGKPQIVMWLIERTRSKTMSVPDVLRQLLEQHGAGA